MNLLELTGITEIRGFQDEYRFLSNFYPAKVVYNGRTFASVEHAYQAAKSTNGYWVRVIQKSFSPAKAKNYGRLLTEKGALRSDWHQVKVEIMYDLLTQKFNLHQDLRDKLIATGDSYLEETNTWGDKFWGVCNGVGENILGKLLMKIRSELNTTCAISSTGKSSRLRTGRLRVRVLHGAPSFTTGKTPDGSGVSLI